MRLNRRVRSRTHGGVRGRGKSPFYSIFWEKARFELGFGAHSAICQNGLRARWSRRDG